MAQERKIVTVLFADIVGSTAIGAAHDPEVLRQALAQTFGRMREVLAAYGATVEKFIGDAVMAIFGLPVSHEDDADRAVRSAFALLQVVAERNVSSPLQLDLRIGIDTGHVVAASGGDQFLVTGTTVNAAARLQQAAAPGEVLAGPLTRRLTAGLVDYGTPRRIEAKGLGILEGAAAKGVASPVPGQRRGAPAFRARLIGRDEELRALTASYQQAHADHRAQLVTVLATAGVGKSRLVSDFTETLVPAPVLRGRCLPYGEGITFWPVQEMLRSDAGILADDSRDTKLQKVRSAAKAALPDSSDVDLVAARLSVLAGAARVEEAIPEVTPENVARELRWSFRRYVEGRARDAGFVLVFDDIHWAEPALLDLVEHVIEWSRGALLVLCTARPELIDARPSWARGERHRVLRLEALTAQETATLIAELLPAEKLPGRIRADVVARSEGNPLYVQEFLRLLLETGQSTWADWTADAMPPTVQTLIAARLDYLAPEVKRTLQHASVIGKIFWTTALAALAPEDDRLEEHLFDAQRRDLIVDMNERAPAGGWSFRFGHILTRNVAYEALPKSERIPLHDRFGRWLETAAAGRGEEYADVVAYHAEQAFLFAHELHAPERPELARRGFDHLFAVGTRARRRGDTHAARTSYERAAVIAEVAGLRASERAEARGFSAIARWQLEGTTEALKAIDDALELARAAGPREVLVRLLIQRGFLTLAESLDGSRALFAEGVAAARATGDPELVAYALVEAYRPAAFIGDIEEESRILNEAYAFIRSTGAKGALGECLTWLAELGLVRGDFGAALRRLEEVHELAEASGAKFDGAWARYLAAHLLSALRDTAAAIRAAEQSFALATELGVRHTIARAGEALGEALYHSGELARSRAVLEQALATVDPVTMRGTLPEVQGKLALACLRLGDLDAARRNAEAASASVAPTDAYSQATTRAALASVRAAEGRVVDAERLLREALDLLRPKGNALLTAEVQQQIATFLIAQGRSQEARPLLEAARGFFLDPLAVRRREEIDVLLRRSEERLRRPDPSSAGNGRASGR
jgi:class 3 adenylate cyclase/tetratricopeptide (TPR) repeat protein